MTDLRASDLRTSDLQASDLQASLHGLWLPLVTPFRNGELDETSLRRLARHYAALPVNGLILAATTGESLTLTREETERLVFAVRDEIGGGRLPAHSPLLFPGHPPAPPHPPERNPAPPPCGPLSFLPPHPSPPRPRRPPPF